MPNFISRIGPIIMSDTTNSEQDLRKMKFGDLKKLCKKHNLPTSGTKMEVICRLMENNCESFTILQPGDEEKLLGDVDDVEATPITVPLEEKPKVVVTIDKVTPVTEAATIPAGSKRPAAAMEPESPTKPLDTETSQTTETVEKTDSEVAKTESDLLTERAIRFGLSRPTGSLTDDKLAARARRFGLPVNETGSAQSGLRNQSSSTEEDEEKRRKRAERFGTVYSEAISDNERKARRLERFGTSSLNQTEEEKLRAARAIKFGLQTDEETLMKRKARFGVT